MRPRFFLPLLVRLAVITAGPLAVGWWLVGPIGGGAAAVVLLLLELWRIDRTVRTCADDRVAFAPTPPGDLTWLDEDAIRGALRDLRLLGFQPVADCTYAVPVMPPGFTRLLVHRSQRAYACVAQGRRGTHSPEAVSVTLFSALDDGRTLTSTTSQPAATMAFGLERIDSWQIRPGTTVHELVVEHLATRGRLCARASTDVSGDGTLADFAAAQHAMYLRQAQECRMNGALGAIRRGLKWERHERKSWVEGSFSKEHALPGTPTGKRSRRRSQPIPAQSPAPMAVPKATRPPNPRPKPKPKPAAPITAAAARPPVPVPALQAHSKRAARTVDAVRPAQRPGTATKTRPNGPAPSPPVRPPVAATATDRTRPQKPRTAPTPSTAQAPAPTTPAVKDQGRATPTAKPKPGTKSTPAPSPPSPAAPSPPPAAATRRPPDAAAPSRPTPAADTRQASATEAIVTALAESVAPVDAPPPKTEKPTYRQTRRERRLKRRSPPSPVYAPSTDEPRGAEHETAPGDRAPVSAGAHS